MMVESTIASPCNGVCTLDPKDNICLGCFRTNVEIAEWRACNDDRRTQILDLAAKRKSAH